MPLIVEGSDDRTDRDDAPNQRETQRGGSREALQGRQRRIDVTDLHAAGIDEYVRTNVETDDVSLEHRAGRTFLLVAE